jgi:hypothetical protein
MALHRMTIAAALIAAFTTTVSAVSPSPPEQPTAGSQGDRTNQPAPRLGPDVTPGWSLMTQQERQQLQQDLQATQSREDCRAVMDRHTSRMTDRASARGISTAGGPRRDVCSER